MSEQPDQIVQPVMTMTRNERKHLLMLACTADRAAWKRACQPKPGSGQVMGILRTLLPHLDAFSFLLPRKLGGLLRGANFLTQIVRQFGIFKFL